MKKRMRTVLAGLLALVFVGSGTLLLRELCHQQIADRAYEEAEKIALLSPSEKPVESTPVQRSPELPEEIPDPPVPLVLEPVEPTPEPLPEEAELLTDIDLDSLRETNEDVIGWLHIPDSVMSYPLMRSHDNNEYLSLAWDKSYSKSGSIFLEQKSDPELTDFHTLIYGHNLQNGKMFSHLLYYKDQVYLNDHRCIYIATDDVILRYEVFAAYTADVVSDTYRLYFEDDARKQSVIDFYLQQSEVESDLIPTVEDRILTLSTCTGRGIAGIRWVVHAVLTGEFPR